MSDFSNALNKFNSAFWKLTQKDENTGKYNFYIERFYNDTKDIGKALDGLLEDETGWFDEFIIQCMPEALDLIRVILLEQVYVKYHSGFNPAAVFKTREEYVEDEEKRQKRAQKELDEHYAKLARYYAGLTTVSAE